MTKNESNKSQSCWSISPFDTRLTVRRYWEVSRKLSWGIRLALLSDLHGTWYGRGQAELAEAVRRLRPDLILMAGDMADHRVLLAGTQRLLMELEGLCPAFYVSGNHEQWTRRMEEIFELFRRFGVTPLAGETRSLEIRGQQLLVGGVDDPHAFVSSHHSSYLDRRWERQFASCRAAAMASPQTYNILLTHRPELAERYRGCGFDLVVAGHAHGGQIRLPLLAPNGLLAPHQGLWPRFAGGQYRLGETSLIVSRGLSRSRLPRIWNPPELVAIDVICKN